MHSPINDLSFEQALARWTYDAATGAIFRKGSSERCETKQHDGYFHVYGFGRSYKAHRIAWLLHYGKWPLNLIDHINGDRRGNRIVNLRDVMHAENQRNQPEHRVTKKSDGVTENDQRVTNEGVTLSRARAPLRGLSQLSRVTENTVTVTAGRDSDSPSTPSGPGPSPSRRATSEHVRQFTADPRFAAWVAGGPAR